jgi:hypothetical protein
MTEGILVVTQIKQLSEEKDYITKLNAGKWTLCEAFGIDSRNFLKPKRG